MNILRLEPRGRRQRVGGCDGDGQRRWHRIRNAYPVPQSICAAVSFGPQGLWGTPPLKGLRSARFEMEHQRLGRMRRVLLGAAVARDMDLVVSVHEEFLVAE